MNGAPQADPGTNAAAISALNTALPIALDGNALLAADRGVLFRVTAARSRVASRVVGVGPSGNSG